MAASGTTGMSGANMVSGTDGADKLNGGAGTDSINAGAGADKIAAGSGDDTIDGGAGSDTVNGDAGNDTLIYSATGAAAKDVYDGGSGYDTLRLELTSIDWNDATRARLTEYNTFLNSNVGSNGEAKNTVFTFTFGSGTYQLDVSKIEQLTLSVDGRYMTTVTTGNDGLVVLGAATDSVVEDGFASTLNALDQTWDVDGLSTLSVINVPMPGSLPAGVTYNAGTHSFTLDPKNTAFQHLAKDQTTTIVVTYDVTDGSTTKQASVEWTVTGVNDTATISGDYVADVIEAGGADNSTPGAPSDSGTVTLADVDDGEAKFKAVAAGDLQGTYGDFTFDENTGAWTYTLRNGDSAVEALKAGEKAHDTLVVTSFDGTAHETITATVTGANDAAVITGTATDTVTEAGGVANDAVNDPTAAGDLDASDVDSPTTFEAQTDVLGTGGYGKFSIAADGAWTYTLDNAHGAVQALNVGGQLTDSLTVATADGTSQVLTVTIDGANDAAVISGTATDTVTEAGGVANDAVNDPTAAGDLDASDVDSPTTFEAQTDVLGTGGYGKFSIAADGAWTYTLDNAHGAVQALNVGGQLTDSLTVATADGTSQVLTVTIDGANDAAVISGTATDTVTEAGGVANGAANDPTAAGDLNATDVDSPATFAAQTDVLGTGGYGKFSIAVDGAWTYTLDNDHGAVQALNVGGQLTDSLTVATADGTSQVLTVTIDGANDAAVISGTATNAVTEAGGVANGAANDPTAAGDLNATDVDSPATFAAQTDVLGTGGYGKFSIAVDGAWTYTLDNDHGAVQALNVGGQLTDSLTVATADGTSQVLTVTIDGANDAAVISGTATNAVTEAGGVANGAANDPTAAGDLNATDVDSPATFVVQTEVAGTNGYGKFSIAADGAWTYTLDNANGAVQALNVGGQLTDSLTVATADGTSQVLTVTIDGANDAPTVPVDTDASNTVNENAVNGTLVGITVHSDDIDGPGLTYSLSDNAGGRFAINGTTGAVTVANGSLLDYETNPSHSITVQASDGAGGASAQTFTIDVRNVAEAVAPTLPTATTDPNASDPNNKDNDTAGSGIPTTGLTGDNRDNTLVGSSGGDVMVGANGGDVIYGRSGDDRINGDNHDDTIYGQAGSDTLNGDNHKDTVYGGSGNDNIEGGAQDDLLYGGTGNDTLASGDGANTVLGGAGADQLNGGDGADALVGGYGADTLAGGGGADHFRYLDQKDTNDLITDFAVGDLIDLSGIDANTATPTDDAFAALNNGNALTSHGASWYQDSANTYLIADTDGVVSTAEFMLTINGLRDLGAPGTIVM